MKTSLKLSAYGAALAVLVAGTYAVGTAVGPVSDSSPSVTAPAHVDDHGAAAATHEPGGLASTSGGYTLVPDATTLGSGTFAFRITGRDGAPVTAFDEAHDAAAAPDRRPPRRHGLPAPPPRARRRGHLAGAAHRPRRGVYRAFADFTPSGGPATTLGVDLFAPGDFQPVTHAASRTSTVDGYAVTLDGDLVRRRRVAAAADRHARRRTRPGGALSRRLRPPRRAARRRPGLPARPPRERGGGRARGRVRRRGAQRRDLPDVLRLPGRRRRADRRLHRGDGGSRHERPDHRDRALARRHDLRLVREPRSNAS